MIIRDQTIMITLLCVDLLLLILMRIMFFFGFKTQSPAAKWKVVELFSIKKQLVSSRNGNLNLQPAANVLFSLKIMLQRYFMAKSATQLLTACASNSLPHSILFEMKRSTLGELLYKYYGKVNLPLALLILVANNTLLLTIDCSTTVMQSIISNIIIYFPKGWPKWCLQVFLS